MRGFLIFLLFGALAWAENFRLYLKDGGFHMVSEYKVEQDRVRYYSIERSDWEEIPSDLVDLKKTEVERKVRADELKKEAALDDAEEKFEREVAREIAQVPVNPGVYFVDSGKMTEVKTAEVKSVTDKKRSILKAMSPIPIVMGKASLELTGDNATVTVPDEKPNFYFRIGDVQRFGIIRLKPKKGARQIGFLNVEPVTKQSFFEMELIDVFRQQLKDNLYKVWPTQPLTPGEYAFVQYVEGEGMIQVWDFRVFATGGQKTETK